LYIPTNRQPSFPRNSRCFVRQPRCKKGRYAHEVQLYHACLCDLDMSAQERPSVLFSVLPQPFSLFNSKAYVFPDLKSYTEQWRLYVPQQRCCDASRVQLPRQSPSGPSQRLSSNEALRHTRMQPTLKSHTRNTKRSETRGSVNLTWKERSSWSLVSMPSSSHSW
jgi:hypothetical protein